MAAEDRAARSQQQWLSQFINRTDPRTWNYDDLLKALGNAQSTGGVDQILRAGDILPAIPDWQTAINLGFQAGSPDPKKAASDLGMSPAQYQSQYGGLPLVFNADGSVTYDPTAQRNKFAYAGEDSGFLKAMDILGPAAFGAGLFGLLPGTQSILSGLGGTAAGAGAGAIEGAFPTFIGDAVTTAGLGGTTAGTVAGTGASVAGGTSGLPGSLGGLTNAQIAAGAETLGSLGQGGGTFATTTGGSALGAGLGGGAGLATGLAGGLGGLETLTTLPTISGPLGPLTLDAAGNIVQQVGDLANSATGSPSTPTGSGGTPTTPPLPPGAPTRAAAMSQLIKQLTGLDVDPGVLDLIGTAAGVGIGYAGSEKAADVAQQGLDFARSAYEKEQAIRAPDLSYYANIRDNPNTWYQSAPAMGGTDAVLRQLSAKVGNPALNPGAISQAAAYNLGGYNQALNSAAARAGVGKTTALSGLENVMGANQAQGAAAAMPYNLAGYGISQLLNNQPNFQTTLQQYLDRYFKGIGGGSTPP